MLHVSPRLLPIQLLRMWAKATLTRAAAVFGAETLCARLQQEIPIFSMFSGVECARQAWEHIHAAAFELYGIETGVTFVGAVTLLRSNVFKCGMNAVDICG